MPMGRRPIPGHLKLLKGTYRKDREPRNPPKPEGDLLRCPDWLVTPEQKQAWAWAISSAPPGLYKKLDRALVAVIAIAEAEVREATAKIAESGLVIGSRKYGVISNPLVRIRRAAMLVLLRALAEAGATPASRSRIEIEPEGGEPDEWDEILGT